MRRFRHRRSQGGFALWLLIFVLTLGFGYGFYRVANSASLPGRQDALLAKTLLRAKEALLARAVTDQNRPGSLPCPDIVTDIPAMNNRPGDGRADMLAGNHCPAYVGWLPWLTLDLPELTDDTGTHLWYALSANLRDDDSAQPLNSATPGSLEIDGQSDIVAIIIAPRAAIGQQQRPSNVLADYLEGGNGLSNKYVSGPAGTGFNDRLISISRNELMAAVGKRLAGELRQCLEQHADAASNVGHRYPWPAPFAAPNYQGKAGSRFGRPPATQPGSGPEVALEASIAGLAQAQTQLANSQDAKQQLALLQQLGNFSIQARNLLQIIFSAASQLKLAADNTAALLHPLAKTISEAGANGQISRSEGTAIRAGSESAGNSLDRLPQLLDAFGLDPYPWELKRRSAALTNTQTAEALAEQISAMHELLSIAYTARPDIAPALSAALLTASEAQQAAMAAAANPGDSALLDATKSAAIALLNSVTSLSESIAASRVNTPASEIQEEAKLLEDFQSDLGQSQQLTKFDALLNALSTVQNSLVGIKTGIGSISTARDESITALATTILLAQSTPQNIGQLDSAMRQAVIQTRLLATRIAANEAADNNLSRTSLLEAIRAYRTAQAQFVTLDTNTPRPPQNDIQNMAVALGKTSDKIDTWLRIIADNSTANALAAKAAPATSDKAIIVSEALENSAYAKALTIIDSVRSGIGSIQAYLNKPDSDNRRKAGTAIANNLASAQALLAQAKRLSSNLSGTTASALPILWNADACDFLRPGQPTWWNDNGWSETLFYQIGNTLKAAPGALSVDTMAKYRLVVISGGPAIPGQRREMANVANFLEGRNADPSRDGDATNPSKDFSATAPNPGFNDRLAF